MRLSSLVILLLAGALCFGKSTVSMNTAQVGRIERLESDDRERIVVHLDHRVAIRRGCVSKPTRLYFDLRNARLGPAMTLRRSNEIRQRGIRVGTPERHVLRLAVDVKKRTRIVSYTLKAPFRLVIDVRPSSQAAEFRCEPSMQNVSVKAGRVCRIVLDAGHGGDDSGAVGPLGTSEADVALKNNQTASRRAAAAS